MAAILKEEDQSVYNTNYGVHREGITHDELVEYYSKWSDKYEQDLCSGRYNGPIIAAEFLSEYLGKEQKNARIIDVAAGTGRVGEELQKLGFTNIDALEPATGMLEVARKKNIYSKLYLEKFSSDRTDVEDDAYDALVIAGGMGEGHIPTSGLTEMIRIVKPGGIVCIVMREEYLKYVKEYVDKLEPYMDELENEGKWEKYSRTVVPNYSFGKNGVVFMYIVK